MNKNKLIDAIRNANQRYTSGFLNIDLSQLHRKSLQSLIDLAYYAYLKQRVAKWGGLSSKKIATMSSQELEEKLLPWELKHPFSKLITNNEQLKKKEDIVRIFIDKYTGLNGLIKVTKAKSKRAKSKAKRKKSASRRRKSKAKTKQKPKSKPKMATKGRTGLPKGFRAIKTMRRFRSKDCLGKGKDSWTIAEIKYSLKANNLPVGGNKTQLCKRLEISLL